MNNEKKILQKRNEILTPQSEATEYASSMIEITFEQLVWPLAKQTISEGQFHEVNSKMEAFLKKIGFPDKSVKEILFAQWNKLVKLYSITLPEINEE